MVSTFESLPNEIQQMVLKDLQYGTEDIMQCILVCKSWKRIYEQVLYSDVLLPNLECIKEFLQTLQANRHLMTFVTSLEFQYKLRNYDYHIYASTIFELFSYLPNLQRIDCVQGGYFMIVEDALLEGQLPSLKFVEPPILCKERHVYARCALLLNDRLTSLVISDSLTIYQEEEEEEEKDRAAVEYGFQENNYIEDDDHIRHGYDDYSNFGDSSDLEDNNNGSTYNNYVDSSIDLGHFHELYDNLNCFKNLSSLTISKDTENVVDLIEDVINQCSSLQHLTVEYWRRRDAQEGMTDLDSTTTILDPCPAHNFKSLSFSQNIFNDPQLIQYTIKKFPHLQTFRTSLKRYCNSKLDEFGLHQFLNYLTKINRVNVQIPFNYQTHLNCIEPFWKIVSQSCVMCVDFQYEIQGGRNIDSLDQMTIDIENRRVMNRFYCAPRVTGGFLTADIIEKYGHYIDRLNISGLTQHTFETSQPQQKKLYERFILLPLHYCIRLERLSLSRCTITESNLLYVDSFKRVSIKYLLVENCFIGGSVAFEKLFKPFAFIKVVELSQLGCMKSRNTYTSLYKQINMPETIIDTLLLAPTPAYCCEYRTLLLRLKIQKHASSYYMYSFDSMNNSKFILVDFEECNSIRVKCLGIGVRCKSIRSLEVQFRGKKVRLENL